MIKREKVPTCACEGCFFYLSRPKKGELNCSKYASPTHEHIDCVGYGVADRFVYYIFKEIRNEKQNETMAP